MRNALCVVLLLALAVPVVAQATVEIKGCVLSSQYNQIINDALHFNIYALNPNRKTVISIRCIARGRIATKLQHQLTKNNTIVYMTIRGILRPIRFRDIHGTLHNTYVVKVLIINENQ